MNKYIYTFLIIFLEIFGLVNTVHSAELRHGSQKQIRILPDSNSENLSLSEFLNLLNRQENNLNTSYVIHLLDNINNNYLSLLTDNSPSKSSKDKSTNIISSRTIKCSPTDEVNPDSSARLAGITFLRQSFNNDISKDVYNSLIQDACRIVTDENSIAINATEEDDNNIIPLEQITLLEYTQQNTEFKPVQTNYIYLQTAQDLNNNYNRDRQSFNYQNNYQSLSLINPVAIKPVTPVVNGVKNNPVVSTKPVFPQGNNPVVSTKPIFPQSNNQPNLNYLNALSGSPVTNNVSGISSSQSQVPSSPILDKLNKEREDQQIQLNQRLEEQRREMQRQAEERIREQERQAEDRRRKLLEEQQQRQRELVQRQQEEQRKKSQLFQTR